MLCVLPSDPCEHTTLPDAEDRFNTGLLVSPSIAILTALVVTPLQFFFELACVTLAKMKCKPQQP